MRRLGRPARERARRRDDGNAKGEHGNNRNKRTAEGRRHDAKDPSFGLGAYGVSCRARAKKVALRRAHGDDSPHATEMATGSPALCRGTTEIRLVKTTGAI